MKSFVIYVDTSDKSNKSAKYTQSIFKDNLKIDINLFKGINTDNVWQTFIDSDFNILDIKRFGGGSIDAEIKNGIHKRLICKEKHNTYQVWHEEKGLCHCDTMWLFGAHAYLLNPSGAVKLVEATKLGILPADVYIRTDLLDIYDYLPHPIKQNEEFTLIQRWNTQTQ